jgi:hypothetical protein
LPWCCAAPLDCHALPHAVLAQAQAVVQLQQRGAHTTGYYRLRVCMHHVCFPPRMIGEDGRGQAVQHAWHKLPQFVLAACRC